MKTKLVVIASKFANLDGTLEIGGVETYISQLAFALGRRYDLCVYQLARKRFERVFPYFKVVGLPLKDCQAITDYVEREVLGKEDILVFSSEQINASSTWPRSIVVQHGVYWDLPIKHYSTSRLAHQFPGFYKLFDNFRNLQRIKRHHNVVCVDYTYSSWLRTFIGSKLSDMRTWVILNSAAKEFFEVESPPDDDAISILFARRFMRFRGTRIFARAASQLIRSHPQVNVTICGKGPDEESMQKILPPSERVTYCEIEHRDMPEMIQKHHIVVVPSLGSEGTSLSAIEGMAAGRAVVASAVGGVPNVIIDRFNGLLVQPGDSSQLYVALRELVDSPGLRLRLGREAKMVAQAQLGPDIWSARWNAVLDEVEEER